MHVKVEKKQANILKVLRPRIIGSKASKLLICSRDGKIPPTIIPDVGEISEALGKRIKANFIYTLEGANITLGAEVYCRD